MKGNRLLFGRSIPTAKFPSIGASVEGTVVSVDESHRHAYDPTASNRQGNPMWWYNGKPTALASELAKMQGLKPVTDPVLVLQTDQRDPARDGDDGQRRVFLSTQGMKKALVDAVHAAGAPELEAGGRVKITFTGLGEKKPGVENAPKLYAATYTSPEPGAVQVPAQGHAAEPEVPATASATGDNPFA